MKFRNYCVVIMGDTNNVILEIKKVAETKPNILDAKGIIIATFSSIATPKELTDYFKLNGRNFLIFDLNAENSGYHMVKDEINEGLFGFLKIMDEQKLKERTEDLIQELSSTTVTSKNHAKPVKRPEKNNISLEERLEEAVKSEDYELAVQLRDEINKTGKNNKKTS